MENKLRQFFQNFGFFKNRQNAILAFVLVAALILPQHFAHAGLLDWILKGVIAAIVWVFAQVTLGIAQALIGVTASLMMTVADPSFVCVRWEGNQCMSSRYTEISFVRDGIILSRDLAGIFLVMALISIGIGVALKLIDAKSSLTKFAASAVLVFITPVITGPIIDFANVFMYSFLKTGAASGVLGQMQLVDAFMDTFGKSWSQDASFASFFLTIVSSLLVLLAFALFAAYTMFRITILFLCRYVALWLLIMLAPLAFAMQALGQMPKAPYFKFFDQMGSYYERWWKEFIAWCFIGINVSLFLYIAGRVSLSLAGDGAKLFRTANVGTGEIFYIINISADFGNILSIIIPILIPLIILHMGYKLSMEWGASGATAVMGAADGLVNLGKTAVMGVGAAAGGFVAGKALASGAGRSAMSGLQGLTTATEKDSRFGKWFKSTAPMRAINQSAAKGLERSDEIIAGRKKAAEGYVGRAKKLDERMEEQGRDGKYMENLATRGVWGEKDYQAVVKYTELAKKGKTSGLSAAEKQKILKLTANDLATRKAIVDADPLLLNDTTAIKNAAGADSTIGEEFLNAYNTKKVKDIASIASNNAAAATGIDLKDPKNSKIKDLFKNLFSTATFGQSFDAEMNRLGLTDTQQVALKEARAEFYKKVKEQAVKDAIGSLNKEKLDNFSYDDLKNADFIKNIAQYSKDREFITGAAQRGGPDWWKNYVAQIPADKMSKTLGMFSAEDFKSMGAIASGSGVSGDIDAKTVETMMANISDSSAFAAYMSQLPDAAVPEINKIINKPEWQKQAIKNNNTAAFRWAATQGARANGIALKGLADGQIIGALTSNEANNKALNALIENRMK